jgi:hypothetical protein
MKKLFLILFVGMAQFCHAAEIRPQFRTWKSSDLGIGEFSHTLISSSTIIFHMVTGSPTVNIGGDSYFVVNQSTRTAFSTDSSTKVFCPLDAATNKIGIEWNVTVSSQAFFSKRGGARAGYLWDWLQEIPDFIRTANPTPSAIRIQKD